MSPCRLASKQLALQRVVQMAPNSPSRTLRQRSPHRDLPKEMKETITVHASDFKKYGNDVNMLRNCKLEDEEVSPGWSTLKIASRISNDPGEEDYIENPWAGKTKHLHDLMMREVRDETGINQQWFPPPTKTGRYETPSPGPKRRYRCSETSTRTSSPLTPSPNVNRNSNSRNDSRSRSHAHSPGAQLRQASPKHNSSNVCVISPGLPQQSPLDPGRQRRNPRSTSMQEGRADSRGRQPSVLAAGTCETQTMGATMRLPPRLPQRPSTSSRPGFVLCS